MSFVRCAVFGFGMVLGVFVVFKEFDKFETLLLSLLLSIAYILIVGVNNETR